MGIDEKKKVKITPVSVMHYIRLIYRSALFAVTFILFLIAYIKDREALVKPWVRSPFITWLVWGVFILEMILRFFPSKLESPGSQKQFKRNYQKSGETDIRIEDNNATMLVAIIWISFNAVFGILYMLDILDDGIMLLISLGYSVCDMICILFFCPFQSWFLKNKCCTTCRIYNWDYAMMFTPLFFIRDFYALSLFATALVLMLRWEITFYRHSERFSVKTNGYLRCEGCTEKLCAHKDQLHGLWKKTASLTARKISFLRDIKQ